MKRVELEPDFEVLAGDAGAGHEDVASASPLLSVNSETRLLEA